MRRPTRTALPVAVLAAAVACLSVPPGVAVAEPVVADLPLGPAGTTQSATVEQLAPGLTHTTIVRGAPDPATPWVVELSIPAGETSPDPDAPARAVQDRAAADALVERLAAAGVDAQAEAVQQPAVADLPAAVIGYRVRLTTPFADQGAADAAVDGLRTSGFSARSWYRGWDGGSEDPGRWTVNVLTIDPDDFTGELGLGTGPDLERRETVSQLAAEADALAAVNGGFFVLDPAAGAPGDPAGATVVDGTVLSEPVGRRPVLVLPSDADGAAVVRPTWRGEVIVQRRDRGTRPPTSALDGLNRVPGLIRNCGGLDDVPFEGPRHDATCTDDAELVAFTTDFGASTPTGPGAEVVLDAAGRVRAVHADRGVVLADGQRSVQATGDRVAELAGVRVGDRLRVTTDLSTGRRTLTRDGVSVVNGGPELLRRGEPHITQRADGMWRADDPSFAYGWVLQRNPRTFAGVDAEGRTLLVTVDGRQPDELGLSIPETAAVAQALGMESALNLDGGGSTAMVVGGDLVSSPSDAAGERPVGDVVWVR
ncbi:sporulation domain-containing protein [Desertihabitans brevis]|uniref:Sporulation domain-containing protein n=1 Tax=Desertihabitans brevis TaxID=2268447 RepID=A0A367YYJ9_9ACTN|nr:phosphodiester glycosidase family protein [Desertihabitans brevis]RCK70031.1 sporulation domain-containing protein [Desertihabitans brevis]